MTVVVDQRIDVNLGTLRRVALDGERVRLSDGALATMSNTHDAFQRYVENHRDTFIYGITAGGGPDARRSYTLEESRARRQRGRRWLRLSFGGEDLPEYVSRAAVFARLPMLVSGNTATHPERAQAVARMLDGPLPRLPARGLVAAGELMPNFILRPDDGEPPIASEGFSAGSGNGSQTSNALAGLTAIFARRRLELTERFFALSIDAFRAPLDAYHPALKELWNDPFESASLDALQHLLEGAATERRPFQAPVSYRILPRLLGQAHRALAMLEDVATTGLSEVVSNPTFVLADDGREEEAISTGGYHNASAAPAIDSVAAVWVDLASIAHRHTVKFHKADISLLPDRLLPEGTDYTTGYSTTYLEYVPNQAVEEMRRLVQPTLLTPAEIAGSEQDDIAITAPIAYTTEREVAVRFDEVLAVLAVTCSQALHVTGAAVAPRLEGLLGFVRDIVPPIESRRPLGEECGRLAAAISAAVEHGETMGR